MQFIISIRPHADCTPSKTLLALLDPVALGAPVSASAGTPGPYNKSTFLIHAHNGKNALVAKIASSDKATRLVENEAFWLRSFSGQIALTDHTPQYVALLREGPFTAIVQTILSGARPPKHLTSAHLTFIKAFHGTPLQATFADSPMYDALKAALNAVASRMPPLWVERSEKALLHLEREFGDGKLPWVPAHRDFTRWNMRLERKTLKVFDWEYATTGYVPLYDLLHYLILPKVLRAKSISVAPTLRTLTKFLEDENTPQMYLQNMRAQTLAYLLDLALFYIGSEDDWNETSKVVAAYGLLIDTLLDKDI